MKHFHRRYHQPGTPPGSYDVDRIRAAGAPRITVTDYSPSDVETRSTPSLAVLGEQKAGAVRWINIAGTPSVDVLDNVGERYNVDSLALEDVVNIGQRPKLTEFENGLFVTLIVPERNRERHEQLSLFVRDRTLISFSEMKDDLFQPIHERLASSGNAIRHNDAYYLLYAIIDLVIDLYFPLLDNFASQLAELEDRMLDEPDQQALAETHKSRNQLMLHRRNAWATRDVVSNLTHHLDAAGDTRRYIRPYLQDCHDHVIGVIDLIESYRELASSLIEIYLSAVSLRLNDVMRVLTVIATIFIPPTFIVGLYGMNFDRSAGPLSMPELGWPYGYIGVLGVIGLMMVGLLLYFKRKGWI